MRPVSDWSLRAAAKACAACRAAFPGGATIVSGLRREAQGFVRDDFCEGCFPDASGFASRWHTRIPVPPPSRPRLDPAAVYEFFRNLEGDAPSERAFRYVLALYLVRRKVLRLEGAARGALKLAEAKGDRRFRIPEEPMTPERIQETFGMLQRVLAAPGAAGAPIEVEAMPPPA